MTSVFKAIGIIDKFTDNFEVFKKNPDLKYGMFEFFTAGHIFPITPIYAQIPAHVTDGLVRRELHDIKDKTALTAFLFARMNILNVQLNRQAAALHNLNVLVQHLQAELNKLKN